MRGASSRAQCVHDTTPRCSRQALRASNNKEHTRYDAIGLRRFLIEPEGGRFTTAYDDAGRIRFLVNPQGYRTSWTHDAADRVKVQYLGNSTRASYSYDDANRLLKLANIRSDATTISSFDYAYDSVGNRTRVVESDGIRVTWSYDAKYQLTRERRSGANAYDITYSYDSAGNRRVKLEDSIRTTYAYDAANQLRYHEDNTGRTTYTFDANGNQRIVKAPSAGVTTNTWDYENKLTRVLLPSGVRNTHSYDADGKRVKKEDSSGTTKFLWDAENILLETDSSNVIQAVYSQEPILYGNLISQYRSATTSFYHFDGLGSTDRLTNSLGIVTDVHVYTAFGVIVLISGSTVTPFRFVGRVGYFCESDLHEYVLRARVLHASNGQFLSRDSLVNQPNTYTYVANRPLVLVSTDPSGNDVLFGTTFQLIQGIDPAGDTSVSAPGVPDIDCQSLNKKIQQEWDLLCRRGTVGTLPTKFEPCFGDDALGKCLKQLCESSTFPIRIECHSPSSESRCAEAGKSLCGFVERSEMQLGAACSPAIPKNRHGKLIIHICNQGTRCGPREHTLLHEMVHLCSMPGVPGVPHGISEGCEAKCYPSGEKEVRRGNPALCCCPKVPVIIPL